MEPISILETEKISPPIERPAQNKQRLILTAIKLLISCGLMVWVLQGTELSQILDSIRGADFPFLVVAFSLSFLGYVISVSRWKILLQAQGIGADFFFLIKSFLVSIFFNNLLPSTVGGDIIRAYDSWRLGATKAKAGVVIFVDRFLGLLALVFLALIGWVIAPPLSGQADSLQLWIIGGLCMAVVVVWNIFFSTHRLIMIIEALGSLVPTPLRSIVMKILDGFQCFHGRFDTLGKALTLSLVLQINVVFQYFLVAEGLHFQVPLWTYFFVIPVALFLMLLPISINGIGIRESVFVLLFSPFGLLKAEVLALAWIAYGFILLQGLMGGMVYAFRK